MTQVHVQPLGQRRASLHGPTSWASLRHHVATWGRYALGVFCVALLCVDVATNNWEVIDFIGDAKHLLTPLLTIQRPDDMATQFIFPDDASPGHVSTVGQFMLNVSLAQIQARDSRTFILGMGFHRIDNHANDICGRLVQVYPIADPNATSVRLGSVVDSITFVGGNGLSHGFRDMAATANAAVGMNETQLRARGYTPARHGTDLRLTTPLSIPPPHQASTTTVSMYRFFVKALCSGCEPFTELGLDACRIEYSYNDAAHAVHVTASHAILGQYHELGGIFPRRQGPVVALYVRFVVVVLLLGVYGASQKTVQWTDMALQQSALRRVVGIVAPPLYRQPCSVLDLSDICFNSDVFVVLYTLTVLLDEEIAMLFSCEMHTWHHNTDDMFIEIRLLSMSLRWLWLHCFVLKAAKWTCHFVSMTRFTGDNRVVGWLNFSSSTWIYLGVFVLFQRNDIVELSNSDRVDLHSTTQNLDATFVQFLDSWYIRTIPALAAAMLVNLAVFLCMDHVVNRSWWQSFALNSVGRQLMFNSTSILAGINGDWTVVVRPTDGARVFYITIKARALCTFRWFLSSHLTRFGLVEHPSALRHFSKGRQGEPSRNSGTTHRLVHQLTKRTPRQLVDPPTDCVRDEVSVAPEEDARQNDHCILVQDRAGSIHLLNDHMQELQALSVEVKILRDTTFCLR